MHKLFNAKKEIELSDFVFSEEEKPILTFIVSELNSFLVDYHLLVLFYMIFLLILRYIYLMN